MLYVNIYRQLILWYTIIYYKKYLIKQQHRIENPQHAI